MLGRTAGTGYARVKGIDFSRCVVTAACFSVAAFVRLQIALG
jgi:hypothetical protein